MTISILVAYDHAVVAEGLRSLIEALSFPKTRSA
jgi:hypothetical protein